MLENYENVLKVFETLSHYLLVSNLMLSDFLLILYFLFSSYLSHRLCYSSFFSTSSEAVQGSFDLIFFPLFRCSSLAYANATSRYQLLSTGVSQIIYD